MSVITQQGRQKSMQQTGKLSVCSRTYTVNEKWRVGCNNTKIAHLSVANCMIFKKLDAGISVQSLACKACMLSSLTFPGHQ